MLHDDRGLAMEAELMNSAKSYVEAGGVCGLLLLACAALYKLFLMERADRREAWQAYNKLAKETNVVLGDLKVVLKEILGKLD